MDFILGIEAFNLDKILEMDDAFLEAGRSFVVDQRAIRGSYPHVAWSFSV